MLMPTAVGILGVIGGVVQDKHEAEGTLDRFDATRMRVGFAMMLMLAYGASVGGLLTPVGSPPNLIGRELIEQATGQAIPFGTWMAMAFPICALMFVALTIILLLLNKPEVRDLRGVEDYIHEQRSQLGSMSRAEKNTLIAFAVTVAMWILPAIVALVAGANSSAYEAISNQLDEGVAAVLGASLLFILPTDWKEREFTLRWDDAARIDWGTIILFGTGVIFGTLLESSGLAETIGKRSFDALGIGSAVAITVFGVLLAITGLRDDLQHSLGGRRRPDRHLARHGSGVDPLTPALAATFAASFGFMLPVSTPQNAIVYGSGTVPIRRMIRSGFSFDIIGAALILLILPILASVLL